MILISSDIRHSFSKILPHNQQLLPVSLKRKLSYSGYFLEEFIDVEKIKTYFMFFKEHNPLFKELELAERLILDFEKDVSDGIQQFENLKRDAKKSVYMIFFY